MREMKIKMDKRDFIFWIVVIIVIGVILLSFITFLIKAQHKIDNAHSYCREKCIDKGGISIIFKGWSLGGGNCKCELNSGEIISLF